MRVITCYSFRGGVGRTHLAINLAGILADAQQRVLLVDFDIEAPGLSYLPELAPSESDTRMPRGVVGYLVDAWFAGQAQDVEGYIHRPAGFDERLAVMPAGDVRSTGYSRDLGRLNELDFFRLATYGERAAEGFRLFTDLRKQWERQFDYVVVDSRTGLTDVGGVCTVLLPDELLVMTTLSRQSDAGTLRVLHKAGDRNLAGSPLHTTLVISRVPEEFTDERIRRRMDALSGALGFDGSRVKQLPHTARLLVDDEPLHFRRAEATDRLRPAFEEIADDLRSRNPLDIEWRLDRASARASDGDPSGLSELLAFLIDPNVTLPTERTVRAINVAAIRLAGAPGALERRGDRLSLALLALGHAIGLARARLDYARTQDNRGNVLRDLAGAAEGAPRRVYLDQASAAFDEASRYYRPESDPLDHAATQNNRGTVLTLLAGATDGAERRRHLDKALAAYDEALRYFRPESAPLQHAATQNNRGVLLGDLAGAAEGDEGRRYLEEALAALDAALRFRHPQTAPLDYATTQNNRGTVLRRLAGVAEVDKRRGYLHDALAAFDEALRFYHPEGAPLDYAMVQNNRGIVLRNLGRAVEGDEGRRYLDEALVAFDDALRFYRAETAPLDYATTQSNRGTVLSDLAGVTEGAERQEYFDRALDAYAEALRFRRPESIPLGHAETRLNKAILHQQSAEWLPGARASALTAALRDAIEALLGFEAVGHPALAGQARRVILEIRDTAADSWAAIRAEVDPTNQHADVWAREESLTS
jgi:MinD-like ATPase involved in chromosome partitioning or flagellar assembly/tetratricopeptide (TPR) repeat protein